MCGFLGQISKHHAVDQIKFAGALNTISHRGPDASNIYSLSEFAYFGHHRLAILDLDKASNQPFKSSCGNFILIYNGEIYNYIELRKYLQEQGAYFRTKSDTEVLLQGLILFGTDFLKNLEGMYSFSFIDIQKKILICVRDPFGIKPFYFQEFKGGLVFSSEIRPIRFLTEQGKVNQSVLTDFLLDNSYDHSNETFFSNVMSLGAGECLKYSLETHDYKIHKWFSDIKTFKNTQSYDETVSQAREIIIDSVHKHLRADVPVAVALSGGLDSSGITGIVRHLMPKADIQAFSYIPDDFSISEENWIDAAASHNNIKPRKINFQQSKIIDDLINTIKAHQEPFGSSSIVAQYKIFEAIKSHGIKVTIEGQGADELFCGYTGYLPATIITLLDQKRFHKLSKILNVAIKDKGIKFVLRAIAISGIKILPSNLSHLFLGYNYPQSIINCFDYDPRKGRYSSIPSIRADSRSLRQTLNFALFEHGLPCLLRHADRNSMAHSIESRVPYLHTPLFNYINTVPEHFLFGNLNRPKGFLFDVLDPFISKKLYNRRDKVGFFADEWSILNKNTSDILDHFDSSLNLPNVNLLKAKELIYEVSKNKDLYQSFHWRIIVSVLWASYCISSEPS